MRLLHTKRLKFKEFFDTGVQYSILSHRWSSQEVSYEQFLQGHSRQGYGYEKIIKLCKISRLDGFEWTWIDTCCIDKRYPQEAEHLVSLPHLANTDHSSSAELSEAINSMYAWYRRAQVCYVFLPDVTPCEPKCIDNPFPESAEAYVDHESGLMQCGLLDCFPGMQFRNSVWWNRAWTLQELIAPRRLAFYNTAYRNIGDRLNLHHIICDITSIENFGIARSTRIDLVPFATKMRWAASRQASRAEDIAYCLLGLLDINMPLLYGEGKERAFLRLQKEYLLRNDDDSIFVWNRSDDLSDRGLLAPEPSSFRHDFDYRLSSRGPGSSSIRCIVSHLGVEIEFPVPKVLATSAAPASVLYELNSIFQPRQTERLVWQSIFLKVVIEPTTSTTWRGRLVSWDPILGSHVLFHTIDVESRYERFFGLFNDQQLRVSQGLHHSLIDDEAEARPPFVLYRQNNVARDWKLQPISFSDKIDACAEWSWRRFHKYVSNAIVYRRVAFDQPHL